MAVCDPDTGMHAAFGGAVAAQLHAPRRPAAGSPVAAVDGAVAALDALIGAHADEVGALILEPLVQGAGGMFFYDPAYLRGAKAVCETHDVLFVADEIATGFGRAGRGHAFACDRAGVAPDIMCVGKALTGGYCTLGATLATAEVAAGVSAAPAGGPPLPLMHGPTFMANPLACAIAGASLSLLFRPDAAGAPWWRAPGQDKSDSTSLQPPPAPRRAACPPASTSASGRPFGRNLYTMPPYVAEPADIAKIAGAMRWIAEHLADAPDEVPEEESA
ncbi:N2-acetyl-L-ornithine:2-oxoglutarate 5-aminotransferase [Aureococcus anophagefferens]|nr:N2-acetyl-L-ornithine:2-oxoglutarate 5-aminotransferase [Aureococcus anophagefferens]